MTATTPENPSTAEDMDTAPHSIFRWEGAPGLEHTCYACPTKMNNPKARQTCYGVHSIPCFRYHQTMHAIGTSHKCFACISADEQHEQRHREIARLVNEYKAIEEEESASSIKNKKSTPTTLPLRERDPNTTPARAAGAGRRCQNPPTPLIIPNDKDQSQDEDDIENDSNSPDTASLTTPSTTSSSTTPKPSKAESRTAKRAAKSAKSQHKSLKNQTKLAPLVGVKQSNVEFIATVLHGTNDTTTVTGDEASARHPLASDKSIGDVIERNRRYVSNIKEHKVALLREVSGRRKKEREQRVRVQQMREAKRVKGKGRRGLRYEDEEEEGVADEDEEVVVDAILVKLGVSVPPSSPIAAPSTNEFLTSRTPNNKRHSSSSASGGSASYGHTKMALLAQLRVAVAEDLQKHENEQRQTYIRAGGFWRYVGRQIFDRMCAISEKIDWRTGVIKRDVQDRADDDVVEQQGMDDQDQENGGEEADPADDVVEAGGEDTESVNIWAGRRDDRQPWAARRL